MPRDLEPPETCTDCGLTPIPKLEVVYVGSVVMCSKCAHAPPKRITMFHVAFGSLWVNRSAGGKPVEYVRADMYDELARKGRP